MRLKTPIQSRIEFLKSDLFLRKDSVFLCFSDKIPGALIDPVVSRILNPGFVRRD